MTATPTAFVLDHVAELGELGGRRNLRDSVAQKVVALISSGVLQVGDELPGERDLASAFRVSRESVRGGMQILAAHGVVEICHGARTRIASLDVSALQGAAAPDRINGHDLESIHGARLLIERAVVADAARRMDDETLKALDASLDAQAGAIDDPVRFLICDREFHHAIYRCAANPLLVEYVSELYGFMMGRRRRAMALPGATARSRADHADIVAALRARDADAAVAAFAVHLERIYETTRSVIDDPGGPAGD